MVSSSSAAAAIAVAAPGPTSTGAAAHGPTADGASTPGIAAPGAAAPGPTAPGAAAHGPAAPGPAARGAAARGNGAHGIPAGYSTISYANALANAAQRWLTTRIGDDGPDGNNSTSFQRANSTISLQATLEHRRCERRHNFVFTDIPSRFLGHVLFPTDIRGGHPTCAGWSDGSRYKPGNGRRVWAAKQHGDAGSLRCGSWVHTAICGTFNVSGRALGDACSRLGERDGPGRPF
mmetsp:Transcript_22904/g.74149  ORF Transcript_22904/g.74149 Transcript_22904/m.74149 type:complete len:234 (-) Transcript_22904:643-1344(-)